MALKARGVVDEGDVRVARVGHAAPAWMVNYADLMTEMVVFFVVLYAVSASLSKDMQKAQEDIAQTIEEEDIPGNVKMTKDGLFIELQERDDQVLFASGRAELSDYMLELLDKVSPALKDVSMRHSVLVEGHTDNVPIRTKQFVSNWELSTARATNVVRYVVGKHKLPAENMAAVGYGEYRPVAPNDTSENRARNRRVVFFVKTDLRLVKTSNEKQ